MVYHWRWHGSTRAPRWARLTTTIGLLFACALAALPAAASASTPEVRGEWALKVESAKGTLEGTALITVEANPKGEFAASSVTWQGLSGWSGTFTGTLEGSTASVETSSAAFGPVPAGKFESNKEMKVEAGANTLVLSGKGELTLGAEKNLPAKETLTRVKSGKQIEEQKEREAKEQEEREARANVRGEWALTLESVAGTLKGIALISNAASSSNEFASSSALFEGIDPGIFEGKLEGTKAKVTIVTEPGGGFPEGKFTSAAIAVSSATNPTSMAGTGTFKLGNAEFESKLTATRIRSHQQIVEQEKAEREAKEKQEKEAQEAKEKAEREVTERAAREAKEKAEREAKEKLAREAAEKAALPKIVPPPVTIPPLMPVQVGPKTIVLSHGGALSLDLTNPGAAPEHGHLKLTLAKAGKTASAKHTSASSTLGEASFSIAAHGSEVVKLKLSQSGRAQLTRHKALRVLVTVTTQASGQPDTTNAYSLTLHVAKAHGKH